MKTATPWYRQNLLWIVLLGLVIWGAHSYDSDLRKDNVLYASIAKQTLTIDHPLELKFGDEPYLNKPPLFFWVTALSMKLLGTTVFAAKFPTILFGVGCLILLYRLVLRIGGNEKTAMLAVLIAVLTYPLNRATNACRMESMMVFFLLLAFQAWTDYREKSGFRFLLLTGVSIGLAMLTKGPQALIAIPAILANVLIFDREHRFKRTGAVIFLSLIACLVGGSWYAYMFSEVPGYAENFKAQIFDRMASSGTDTYEARPIYYYMKSILSYYGLFIPFFFLGWKRGRTLFSTSSTVRLYTIFGLLYFIGIHLLATKYNRYLYPLFILAAIPVAAGLPIWMKQRSVTAVRGLAIGAAVVMSVIPVPNLHSDRYARLGELNDMSVQSGLPVRIMPEMYQYWESHAAALFFLDDITKTPVAGAHYQLYRFAPPAAPGPLVLKTPLVYAYAISK